jgi:hypothetical protein
MEVFGQLLVLLLKFVEGYLELNIFSAWSNNYWIYNVLIFHNFNLNRLFNSKKTNKNLKKFVGMNVSCLRHEDHHNSVKKVKNR